jgi:uncharacterized membrane protein YphA (DoxX/SURF4 family)
VLDLSDKYDRLLVFISFQIPMKKYMYCHSTGLLVLRLLLAAVFIYHVIPKFGAPDGLVQFIG